MHCNVEIKQKYISGYFSNVFHSNRNPRTFGIQSGPQHNRYLTVLNSAHELLFHVLILVFTFFLSAPWEMFVQDKLNISGIRLKRMDSVEVCEQNFELHTFIDTYITMSMYFLFNCLALCHSLRLDVISTQGLVQTCLLQLQLFNDFDYSSDCRYLNVGQYLTYYSYIVSQLSSMFSCLSSFED